MQFSNRFSPSFFGCVTKDHRMARAVERLYHEELESAAAYLYRGILVQKTDPELFLLFDELAGEEAHHFRLLGSLLEALGGDLSLRFQLRMNHLKVARENEEEKRTQALLYESLRAERRACELYHALVQYTDDAVVRSVLSYLVEAEEEHKERLMHFFG